jgi:hypothetical protein
MWWFVRVGFTPSNRSKAAFMLGVIRDTWDYNTGHGQLPTFLGCVLCCIYMRAWFLFGYASVNVSSDKGFEETPKDSPPFPVYAVLLQQCTDQYRSVNQYSFDTHWTHVRLAKLWSGWLIPLSLDTFTESHSHNLYLHSSSVYAWTYWSIPSWEGGSVTCLVLGDILRLYPSDCFSAAMGGTLTVCYLLLWKLLPV